MRVLKDTEIIFETDDEVFQMVHEQECCEKVRIESIVGDVKDLIGCPILLAEMVESFEIPPGQPIEKIPSENESFSFTWTFYKLATIKGYVDIRWYGGSNGNYSESVGFFDSQKPIYGITRFERSLH